MFAVFISFLSTFSSASSSIVDSHISNHSFKKSSTIVFFNTITNFVGLPFIFFFGIPHFPDLNTFYYLSIVTVIGLAYQIPYYKSLKMVDASISSSLLQVGTIIIPFFSFFFLKDNLNIHQYIGFFIVIFFSIAINIKKLQKSQ